MQKVHGKGGQLAREYHEYMHALQTDGRTDIHATK